MILSRCSGCHVLVERSIKFDNVKCFACKKENASKLKKQYWINVAGPKDKLNRRLKLYEKYTEKEEGY